ncbi:endonuclease/exonuclease/phosphatase family protein [Leifsonia sp. F6_8S_P_1B]|uniref:Endonuclease/exonuclease/phosphatase family protein n=1 Tax=Leifsonia williamsii TaxID=3035919 RepID=A0ABT8KC94_9MICO|nr:endonuclease/exonuclease/phosphatase family protein [Leifsonia williamsii]MDN4615078.1 endonuclease/exonuclease/phosphatase family protein [Leifsonia williamsii]
MSSLRARRRPRGLVTGIAALGVGALLLWHGALPDTAGAASLIETFLPWAGALIVLLGLGALLRLSVFAGLAVATAAAIWWSLFGAAALPAVSAGAPAFTVVSENVQAGNPSAAAIARDLAGRSPDLIALQELDGTTLPAVESVLDAAYPYRSVVGTVGLWSRYPLSGEERLSLGLGWDRALRVDVATPGAPTSVYAVHLASVRPGENAQRDEMLAALTSTVRADDAGRVLVVGDLNTASTDRTLSPLTDVLAENPDSALGLGFTWPAALPLARLDHAFVRGLTTVSSTVLPDNGSDHRGIEVGLR